VQGDPKQGDQTGSQSEQTTGLGSGDGCSNKSHLGCRWEADPSNDLTVVVDPLGGGTTEPRHIDGGETAARIQEDMIAECVSEPSHDLAAVVNPVGSGSRSPGDIDGGKAAARIQEAMCFCIAGVEEKSHNLAAVVNPEGLGGLLRNPALLCPVPLQILTRKSCLATVPRLSRLLYRISTDSWNWAGLLRPGAAQRLPAFQPESAMTCRCPSFQ
jgi:hypothetical protein